MKKFGYITCPLCNGSGYYGDYWCLDCEGIGLIKVPLNRPKPLD